MSFFSGGSGDDTASGGIAGDTFNYSQGGEDTLTGGGGADLFYFGGAFSAGDRAIGDSGNDTVELSGDYSAGFAIGADQLVSIDVLILDEGGTYDLTLTDVSSPTAGFILEAHGDSIIRAGDMTTGLNLRSFAGRVDFTGGSGDDQVLVEDSLQRADRFDGGGGADTVFFQAGQTFVAAGHSFGDIETIVFQASSSLRLADGNVAAGATLEISDAVAIAGSSLVVDGHKERDGHYDVAGNGGVATSDSFTGGWLSDTLDGGLGDDVLTGRRGADHLTGGAGGDAFVYAAVADSTAVAADLITDLAAGDTIDLSAIDADRHAAGHQSFTVVEAFTHHAGELTWSYDSGADVTSLSGDVNGDGVADLVIHMSGDQTEFSGLLLSAG